jgi:hypothetical protein
MAADLHAGGAEIGGVAHAGPGRRRLRRAPAQIAHGRGRVGNALECDDVALHHAFERPGGDGDLIGRSGGGSGGHKAQAGGDRRDGCLKHWSCFLYLFSE